MNEHNLNFKEQVLNELIALKGEKLQLPHSTTVVALEYASPVSVYLHRFVGNNGNYHTIDVGREFWRIIRHIEVNGSYEIDSSSIVGRTSKYVITLLKNMPAIFTVESDIITGTEKVSLIYKSPLKILSNESESSKENDGCRVTAIVGAGAAIGLGERDNITTKYLTDQLLQNTSGGTQELLKVIQSKLPNKFKCNFEGYFYVVEQFVTFDQDWLNNPVNHTHPFAPFINPDKKVKPNDKKKRPRYVLLEMYQQLMDTIHQYNEYFRKEKDNKLNWYSEFWRKASDFKWDIFTFNYDTTIEQCLESNYIDGYKDNGENTQVFTPKWYLCEFDEGIKHTINHVHGCLLYSGAEPDYSADPEIQAVYSHTQRKWKSYELNKEFLNKVLMGRGVGQTGDFLSQDSIITGLQKTDKIISHPYAFYRTQLDKQLIGNNKVLIVGYSFNDYYVNNMLESLPSYHANYKIVLIDYLSEADDIESRKEYALGEIFKDHNEKKFMLHFVEAVINKGEVKKGDNVWSKFDFSHTKDKYIVSKDEQVMFLYGGFKEASLLKEVIYQFLTNN